MNQVQITDKPHLFLVATKNPKKKFSDHDPAIDSWRDHNSLLINFGNPLPNLYILLILALSSQFILNLEIEELFLKSQANNLILQ